MAGATGGGDEGLEFPDMTWFPDMGGQGPEGLGGNFGPLGSDEGGKVEDPRSLLEELGSRMAHLQRFTTVTKAAAPSPAKGSAKAASTVPASPSATGGTSKTGKSNEQQAGKTPPELTKFSKEQQKKHTEALVAETSARQEAEAAARAAEERQRDSEARAFLEMSLLVDELVAIEEREAEQQSTYEAGYDQGIVDEHRRARQTMDKVEVARQKAATSAEGQGNMKTLVAQLASQVVSLQKEIKRLNDNATQHGTSGPTEASYLASRKGDHTYTADELSSAATGAIARLGGSASSAIGKHAAAAPVDAMQAPSSTPLADLRSKRGSEQQGGGRGVDRHSVPVVGEGEGKAEVATGAASTHELTCTPLEGSVRVPKPDPTQRRVAPPGLAVAPAAPSATDSQRAASSGADAPAPLQAGSLPRPRGGLQHGGHGTGLGLAEGAVLSAEHARQVAELEERARGLEEAYAASCEEVDELQAVVRAAGEAQKLSIGSLTVSARCGEACLHTSHRMLHTAHPSPFTPPPFTGERTAGGAAAAAA